MFTEISLIAAMSLNRVIGKDGKIPWDIKEDKARFKKLTLGNTIIMGKNTWISLGERPLPGRTNIWLSHSNSDLIDSNFSPPVFRAKSLDQAISVAGLQQKPIFIIGGEPVYREAMPRAKRIYLTVVKTKVEGDTHFPDFSDFEKVVERTEGIFSGYHCEFLTLEK